MTPSFVRTSFVRAVEAKFTVSAGAVVTNADGKVLLLDHVLRPGSGWGIPGGFVNRGEQAERAIKREICEEIGLEIERVELVGARTNDRHVEILFRARARGAGKVSSLEIKRIGWFAPDAMPQEMNRAQKEIIKRVLSKPADK